MNVKCGYPSLSCVYISILFVISGTQTQDTKYRIATMLWLPSHIHRECKMVADYMAKRRIDNEIGLCRLPEMPEFAPDVVTDDMIGLVRLLSLFLFFFAYLY